MKQIYLICLLLAAIGLTLLVTGCTPPPNKHVYKVQKNKKPLCYRKTWK